MKILPRILLVILLIFIREYIIYWKEWNLEKLSNTINSNNKISFKITNEIWNNLTTRYFIIKIWFIILLIIMSLKYLKKYHINKNQFKDIKKDTITKNLKIKYIRFPENNIQFSVYDWDIEYISEKIPIKQSHQNNYTHNENFSVWKWWFVSINWHVLRRWDIMTVYINPKNPKNYRIDTDFLYDK